MKDENQTFTYLCLLLDGENAYHATRVSRTLLTVRCHLQLVCKTDWKHHLILAFINSDMLGVFLFNDALNTFLLMIILNIFILYCLIKQCSFLTLFVSISFRTLAVLSVSGPITMWHQWTKLGLSFTDALKKQAKYDTTDTLYCRCML